MGIKHTREGKLLYHLTRLDNLKSIIKNGLVSRSILNKLQTSFKDIASEEIITKRTILGLDSYVPFHFHPYSSFDAAVKNTYRNDDFIYICVTRKLAIHNEFKIIPIHPLATSGFRLYSYTEGFDMIDWDKMHTSGNEYDNVKHVKMAECLTNLRIPFNCFHSIYVGDNIVKNKVIDIFKENGVSPPYVNIQPWFNKDKLER